MSSSALACAAVRGNPSSTKPATASGCNNRSRTMPMIRSSPTSSPRSITALTLRPSSVPLCTASRRMSPVETLGIPCSRAKRSACVPFPAPGGPSITRFKATLAAPSPDPRLLHEPVVMPHDQLRLDLIDGVHGHADHDQERRAAEVELYAE